ncbi:MAG: flagellar basal body P-ring protein FlgI [Pirellulales bacterium]
MKRRAPDEHRLRVRHFVGYSLAGALVVCFGCMNPVLRQQSPEARLDLPPTPDVPLVSEYTHPYGLDYTKIEAVSLVTGLAGTGSDPPPSPQRAALLDEMNRRNVSSPNEVLASPNTSLVLVRGYLRPGIQKGDHFDVEVRVPSRSESTSIRGGWLLSSRLTEMAVLGEQIRQGSVLAHAEGPVLVDPSADPKKDPALSTRGRVLGGGIALKSRSLGLVIGRKHQSIRLSQQMAASINKRFYTHVDGRKQGVATPKTEEFIEIALHERYKDNVGRYMRVLRSVAVNESAQVLQDRMQLLQHQLADPLTAANAAIRLEAIGNDQAIEILSAALKTSDPEVRFYAAEALAYLDQTVAVETLASVARDEPAFRVNALAALSAMDDVMAYDALRDMLSLQSAETRYGAFRALWAMNEHDPLVRGVPMADQFTYHELDVAGPEMVHVTESYRPEVVVFGKGQTLSLPLLLDAGPGIVVNGQSGDKIVVSRFTPGQEQEQRAVSTNIADVVRAIVELGGTYPDVVQALQQAKHDGAYKGRFLVDALPQSGRQYDREAAKYDAEQDEFDTPPAKQQESPLDVSTPLPDLFTQQR